MREVARSTLAAVAISLVILAPGGWRVYSNESQRAAAQRAKEALLATHDRLIAAPPAGVLPVDTVVHGKGLFETTCAVCHKGDGTGLPTLGKDLTASWFVASLDDEALRRFVVTGRPTTDELNTTRVAMPPKGGHEELTEADLADIIVYVRGLQDRRRMPELPASAFAPPAPVGPATQDEVALALAAAGGDEELAGFIAHGTKVFAATCAACHGKDGKGLPSLGKSLVDSEFARKLDDDGLLAFVKRGRDPGDAANTTGVAMPPRGGNPALSDDDILDVIAYVRTLQPKTPTTP